MSLRALESPLAHAFAYIGQRWARAIRVALLFRSALTVASRQVRDNSVGTRALVSTWHYAPARLPLSQVVAVLCRRASRSAAAPQFRRVSSLPSALPPALPGDLPPFRSALSGRVAVRTAPERLAPAGLYVFILACGSVGKYQNSGVAPPSNPVHQIATAG
jgi:hypothetical protein